MSKNNLIVIIVAALCVGFFASHLIISNSINYKQKEEFIEIVYWYTFASIGDILNECENFNEEIEVCVKRKAYENLNIIKEHLNGRNEDTLFTWRRKNILGRE